MAIIGIDLGTTNSLGCVYKNRESVLIPNAEGTFLTASAVSLLEDGTVIVGNKAKERKISYPEQTALSFKRFMGSTQKISLGKKAFLPEELSAFVIRSILDDAEKYLGETIEEAVISVPAYFNDKQRAATKRAGALAGVRVDRIVNEPSAAALSSYRMESEERHFLVFDFGGGTLDVSLVNCVGNVVEIQAVAGDNRLGGDDFDHLIADQAKTEWGVGKGVLTQEQEAALLKKASVCKETLSAEESAVLEMTLGQNTYTSTWNMKRLMDASAPILSRIKQVIGNVLKDAKMRASNVTEIIMVGGSSKMPLIQSYLRHLFHRKPVVADCCDDMIALGLGYFCGIKEQDPELEGYMLTDVCPFSLGTGVLNHNDPGRDVMSRIISRNRVIPASYTAGYSTTADMQKTMKIRVYQGENMYVDENLKLGELEVPITPKPKGEENINVTFTYDINGILIVDVKVPSTGKNYTKVLSESLSESEMKKRMEELQKLKVNPEDRSENRQLIEKLKELYPQANPQQQEAIAMMLNAFGEALQSRLPSRIVHCRKMIELNLKKIMAFEPFDEFGFGFGSESADDDWDDPWADDDLTEEEAESAGDEDEMLELWEMLRRKTYLN